MNDSFMRLSLSGTSLIALSKFVVHDCNADGCIATEFWAAPDVLEPVMIAEVSVPEEFILAAINRFAATKLATIRNAATRMVLFS
jgi:hypothetical protein